MRIGWTSLAPLALCLLATSALADVDVELPAKAAIRGTLMPVGEVDVFRVEAVAGTELTLVISAKKKAPLDFDVTITGPDMAALDPTDAKAFTDQGRKVSIKALPLLLTGTYTIRIASLGTGTGEYKLSIKTKPLKKATDSEEVEAAGTATIGFSAPAGSIVTLKAKAAKGSAAVPRFGAFGKDDLSTEGKLKPTSHVVKLLGVEGGDLEVEISNDGTATGTIDVVITVKAPKSKAAQLDVRGGTLGKPAGGETYVGAFVDGEDGGTVEVDDEDSDVDGASATVPAGAFDGALLVSIVSAPADAVADGALQGAGPTLALGPPGTVFSEAVTLVLPYDPSRLPVGARGTDLTVQRLGEDGTQEVLAPVSVDAVENTVSVEVTGFSTFTAIVPRGSPSLDGRAYWFFGQDVELIPDAKSGESLSRAVLQDRGEVSFVGEGSGSFSFTGTELVAEFGHDAFTGIGTVQAFIAPLVEGDVGGTWDYEADGRRITIEVEPGDTETYFVSADGSMLVPEVTMDDDAGTRVALFIEQPAAPPTPAQLAGTYWVFDYRFEAVQSGGPLEMAGANSVGTFTIQSNGTFKVVLTEREALFDGGAGEAFDRGVGKGTITGTYDVQMDGSLLFDFGENEIERFFPNVDTTLIVGSENPAQPIRTEGLFSMAVLVRQGSGLGPSAFDGDYLFVGQEMEYEPVAVANTSGPDFETVNLQDIVAFDGSNALNSTAAFERIVRRDGTAPGGVSVTSNNGDFLPPTFSLTPAGKFTVSEPGEPGGLNGASNPSGSFVFGVQDTKTPEDLFAAYLLMELPPEFSRP